MCSTRTSSDVLTRQWLPGLVGSCGYDGAPTRIPAPCVTSKPTNDTDTLYMGMNTRHTCCGGPVFYYSQLHSLGWVPAAYSREEAYDTLQLDLDLA
jgi:hypothetical protein